MIQNLLALGDLNDKLRTQMEILEHRIERLDRMGPEAREQVVNEDTMEVLKPEIQDLAKQLQAAESTARSLTGRLDRCFNARIARR